MPKPNLFIVGAAKSGTTALYDYLAAHPDIYMSAVKEPRFFGSELAHELKSEQFAMTLDEYLKLFDDAKNERYIGEATPSYLIDATAARELYDFAPDARILMTLRNPVDMLHSAYQHRQFMGADPKGSFEGIVIPAIETQDGTNFSIYRRFIQYTNNVKRYFDTFDREQVRVLIFEEWVKNPQSMYSNLLNWLDLPPYQLPEFKRVNASKEVRSSGLVQILGKVGLTPAHIKRSAIYNLTLKILPPAITDRLISGAVQMYTRPAEKIALSPETRAYLLELLNDEITALEALLKQDLSHWQK